jgi:hypothetical protein
MRAKGEKTCYSAIFLNLWRNGSLFGFWIFSAKYPLGVPGAQVLHE